MDSEEMKRRTKEFAIKVGILTQGLPDSPINRAYCNQIIRSSSSVGTNYRASRRAKSNADFINKLNIVEEEPDESLFFLECRKCLISLVKRRLTPCIAKEKLY
ncbi:MAG: four helix bundle protein [Ferruginibacter sp.]